MRIEKADRHPWARTRTRQRLDALARTMGQAVGLDLAGGLRRFKKKVPAERVYQAWLTQNPNEIMRTIPWQSLGDDMEPAFNRNVATLRDTWAIAVPAPIEDSLRFDTANPRVREFVRGRRALNFTNLTEDSAANIQNWVLRSFDKALSPRQVADGIKSSIGLLPAHAAAVENYRAGLLGGGLPERSVDRLSGEYAERLLDYRAMMIGRTETRLATNEGQNLVWRQAGDRGLVDRDSTGRRWIVDGDPCPDCLAMDGRVTGLDTPWVMADGTVVDCPPEGTHPHCECTFEMVFGVKPGEVSE